MKRVLATILVPTHDHGATLDHSVASALAQTVGDIEVFVVGDGAPDASRERVERMAKRDRRLRWFGFPKGARHGETHRNAALEEARGSFVCYLADDDLYLPEHVATMAELLRDADFAHTLPTRITPEGEPEAWAVDLSRPVYRRLLRDHLNRVPLGAAAHTMELFRRLPHRWRTTPAGIPTDVYMWAQILSVPGVRVASGRVPTMLHFPSPDRRGVANDARAAELAHWRDRLASREGRASFDAALFDFLVRDRARLDERVTAAERTLPARAWRRLRRALGFTTPGAAGSARGARPSR